MKRDTPSCGSSLLPIRVMAFGKGKDIWVRVRIRILDIKGNEKGYSLLWVEFTLWQSPRLYSAG